MVIPDKSCEYRGHVLTGQIRGQIVSEPGTIITDNHVPGRIMPRHEVRDPGHVWIARIIDLAEEDFLFRLRGIGHRLHDIFFRIRFSVPIGIMVSFNPIIEGQRFRITGGIFDGHRNLLFRRTGFIVALSRPRIRDFRRRSIDSQGPAPRVICWHDLRRVAYIVSLNFKGHPFRYIHFRHCNRDEEGTIRV